MFETHTSPNGLTDSEVLRSRNEHGQNVLTPPAKISLWKLYLEKYSDPIIRILLVAAAISLVIAFVENDFFETPALLITLIGVGGACLLIFLGRKLGFLDK